MKHRIFLLVGILFFVGFSLKAQYTSKDFTNAGNKINCITAKFLLKKDTTLKNLNKIDCNNCKYDLKAEKPNINLKDALQSVNYEVNKNIAKAIESKKIALRNKIFSNSNKVGKKIYNKFLDDLIRFSITKIDTTKHSILELKQNYENEFSDISLITEKPKKEEVENEMTNQENSNVNTNIDTTRNTDTNASTTGGDTASRDGNNDNVVFQKQIDSLKNNDILFIIWNLLLTAFVIYFIIFNKRKINKAKVTEGNVGNNNDSSEKDDKYIQELKNSFNFPKKIIDSVYQSELENWKEVFLKRKYTLNDRNKRMKDIKEYIFEALKTEFNNNYYNKETAIVTIDNFFAIDNWHIDDRLEKFNLLSKDDIQFAISKHTNELKEEYSDIEYIKKTDLGDKLEDINKKLESDLSKQQKDAQNESANTQNEAPVIQEEKVEIGQKFYAPFPDPEGYFWKDQMYDAPDTWSAYEIDVLKNDSSRARFRFWKESKNLNSAIQGYTMYIEPVCEIINYDNSGTKINQVGEDGELFLDGDKWRVVSNKKLKIEIV